MRGWPQEVYETYELRKLEIAGDIEMSLSLPKSLHGRRKFVRWRHKNFSRLDGLPIFFNIGAPLLPHMNSVFKFGDTKCEKLSVLSIHC